jgi:hypothetical protein
LKIHPKGNKTIKKKYTILKYHKDLMSLKDSQSDNKLANKHKTNIPNKFIPA